MNCGRSIILFAMVAIATPLVLAVELSETEGPLITPPKLLPSSPREIGRCYASSARRSGSEGRVLVTATIETDGRVSKFELSPGVEAWQQKTAECVMDLLRFLPATKDGVPAVAEATVPLNFSLVGSPELNLPALASTELEVEEAYRACYPQGQLATATPKYRVALSPKGVVRNITLVESVGDEGLDQAGICVLKLLKFEPARRGRVPIESTAILPIFLRPPK